MYLRDYKRIRKAFPARRKETMVDYFERLASKLTNKKGVLFFE